MKKLIMIVLSIFIITSLVACGNNKGNSSVDTTSSATQETNQSKQNNFNDRNNNQSVDTTSSATKK